MPLSAVELEIGRALSIVPPRRISKPIILCQCMLESTPNQRRRHDTKQLSCLLHIVLSCVPRLSLPLRSGCNVRGASTDRCRTVCVHQCTVHTAIRTHNMCESVRLRIGQDMSRATGMARHANSRRIAGWIGPHVFGGLVERRHTRPVWLVSYQAMGNVNADAVSVPP